MRLSKSIRRSSDVPAWTRPDSTRSLPSVCALRTARRSRPRSIRQVGLAAAASSRGFVPAGPAYAAAAPPLPPRASLPRVPLRVVPYRGRPTPPPSPPVSQRPDPVPQPGFGDRRARCAGTPLTCRPLRSTKPYRIFKRYQWYRRRSEGGRGMPPAPCMLPSSDIPPPLPSPVTRARRRSVHRSWTSQPDASRQFQASPS